MIVVLQEIGHRSVRLGRADRGAEGLESPQAGRGAGEGTVSLVKEVFDEREHVELAPRGVELLADRRALERAAEPAQRRVDLLELTPEERHARQLREDVLAKLGDARIGGRVGEDLE